MTLLLNLNGLKGLEGPSSWVFNWPQRAMGIDHKGLHGTRGRNIGQR